MIPWPGTLRGRFLALTFACVLLPMGIVGAWLAHSARSSGEAAVRQRLESLLGDAAQAIAYRWIDHRSALHALAADGRVHDALREGRPPVIPLGDPAWSRLEPLVERIDLFDRAGSAIGEIEGPAATLPQDPLGVSLRVTIPVYDGVDQPAVGRLEARLRLANLLPPGFSSLGIGGGMVSLFDASGTPLLPSPLHAGLVAAPRFQWRGEEWIAVQQTLHEPPLRMAVAAPLGPLAQPFAGAARKGFLALLGVSLLAFAAATVLTSRLTHSLERLSAAAQAVSTGQLDPAVAETGPREVRRLSGAFNSMTESLRALLRTVAQQRAAAAVGEFAASLAHEVRNPLTAVRLDLEHVRAMTRDPALAGVLDESLAQIDRLDATVGGMLRLAASGTLELTPVDVREPLRAAIRSATPRLGEAGALLQSQLPPDSLQVRANAPALEQLFLNLLLNAGEAAGAGGEVRVRVERRDGSVHAMVEDDGPGISADQVARVLEPFYTTKPGGTGLGLAVATRIAEAHGGELRLERRPEGGLRAVVTLPVAVAEE